MSEGEGVYAARCTDCAFESVFTSPKRGTAVGTRAKHAASGHKGGTGHAVDVECLADHEDYQVAVLTTRQTARDDAEAVDGAHAGVETEDDVTPAVAAVSKGYFTRRGLETYLAIIENDTGVPVDHVVSIYREAFRTHLEQKIRNDAGLSGGGDDGS